MLFVAVHIGCGFHHKSKEKAYETVMNAACMAAMTALREGKDALDAAVAATTQLEMSPLTNTGFGSNLNRVGKVECDASVMLSAAPNPKAHYVDTCGPHMLYGAVGAISGVKHPCQAALVVARNAAKEQDGVGLISPICLVGSGAVDFVKTQGVEVTQPQNLISSESSRRYESHSKMKRSYDEHYRAAQHQPQPQPTATATMPTTTPQSQSQNKKRQHSDTESKDTTCPTKKNKVDIEATVSSDRDGKDTMTFPHDTVGVICLDSSGRSAAVSSSGGVSLKLPGRIGQAATFGAGCMATAKSNGVANAVTTTGVGEELVKTQLATAIDRMLGQDEAITDNELVLKTRDICLNSSRLGPCARHEMGMIAFRYIPKSTDISCKDTDDEYTWDEFVESHDEHDKDKDIHNSSEDKGTKDRNPTVGEHATNLGHPDKLERLKLLIAHTTSSMGIAHMCSCDNEPTSDFTRSSDTTGEKHLYFTLRTISDKTKE